MQDRKAWHSVEARRRHVEIFTNANNIRIGIICVDDRVSVGAVAVVCHPNLRLWMRGGEGERKDEHREDRSHKYSIDPFSRPQPTVALRAPEPFAFRSGDRASQVRPLRYRVRESRDRCCDAAQPILSGRARGGPFCFAYRKEW